MAYNLVGDSCVDLTPAMRKDKSVTIVPLTLTIDGYDIVDDETFDQGDFLRRAAASPNPPKSSCPSPEAYMDAFGRDNTDAYCVTLSARLSGSYNSAILATQILKEQFPEKKVHIFDSKSAASGQTLIAMKIMEYADAGKPFEEVVELVEQYIDSQMTLFVLESLEALRKNGRLSGIKATIVNVLNIKPVMAATPEGEIFQMDMGRGIKKALLKMIGRVGEFVDNCEERVACISHCNCPERAEFVKRELLKVYPFKDVVIVEGAGVTSLYASDGGIVLAF